MCTVPRGEKHGMGGSSAICCAMRGVQCVNTLSLSLAWIFQAVRVMCPSVTQHASGVWSLESGVWADLKKTTVRY
jgi:hypothetical protein